MWLSWKFINEVNCSRKSTTWLSSIMLGSSHVPVHFHYCTHFLGFCHGRFVHEMWSLAFHWKLFQPWFLHSVTSFGQVSHELIIAFYASQQLRNLIDFILKKPSKRMESCDKTFFPRRIIPQSKQIVGLLCSAIACSLAFSRRRSAETERNQRMYAAEKA